SARRPCAGSGSFPRADAKGMAGFIRPALPGINDPPAGASSITACLAVADGVNVATFAGAAASAAAPVAAATGTAAAEVLAAISTDAAAVPDVSGGGVMICGPVAAMA